MIEEHRNDNIRNTEQAKSNLTYNACAWVCTHACAHAHLHEALNANERSQWTAKC